MSSPIEVTIDGIRWRVAPEHSDMLLGPHGLRLHEWLHGGKACVIKKGPHRVVYRVELPGLNFYLKHNIVADPRSWLRQLIRPTKAKSEFDRALAVAARGVATVVPLAVGECCDSLVPSESYLLTHTLVGAVPLDAFLRDSLPQVPACKQARLRQLLAKRLGEFIARLHEGGVLQHDLHCGNVLVSLDNEDTPQFYLVDLQAVRLGGRLGWRASRRNLVILNRWLVLEANRSDRFRFWRAYCRVRSSGSWASGQSPWPREVKNAGPGGAELARVLESETRVSNQRFWRNRDQRCLEDNRHYRPVQAGNVAGYVVSDLDEETRNGLLADPDGPFRRPTRPLLKDSRSSTVAELEVRVNGRPMQVIYKRFRVTDCRDPFLSWLRRTPALRSWVYGHGLRQRGLPTARPLAVLHRRRWGMCREGYLLMEKVQDAVDLRQYVSALRGLSGRARGRALRPLIDELARLVRELHRRHLSHRDLKASNLLVQAPLPFDGCCGCRVNGTSIAPALNSHVPAARLWFVDLVGVTRQRRPRRSVRVQNLTRLHASFYQDKAVTRTDKLRFLRAYLQWGLFGRGNWKRWWREVAAATVDKAARNARRGRPLH